MNTNEISLENRLQELNEEAAKIEAELEAKRALPEDKRLAEFLHDWECSWNHTDGCSWYYESWSKSHPKGGYGYAHDRYLNRAQKLLEKFSFEDCIKFLQTLKDYS